MCTGKCSASYTYVFVCVFACDLITFGSFFCDFSVTRALVPVLCLPSECLCKHLLHSKLVHEGFMKRFMLCSGTCTDTLGKEIFSLKTNM